MTLILPNKSMFMRAECTPPSAWTGHIPFAGWLVEATEPAMIVELGTHHGTSYLAFCQAVEANVLPTRCFAVDTWEGDEHSGVYGEEIFAQLHNYHAMKYGGFSRLMRMTFDEAVAYFDDGSIDLLHIDGLHTYDAVRHDFETWLPKLSRRGVIIFHDTCVREREFGVWRFWSEVSKRYPSFEFTHTHGLGVLAVGEEIPPQLRVLVESTGEEDRLLVNQMFESLGRVVDANFEIERLKLALGHERALRQEDRALALGEFREIVRELLNSDELLGDEINAGVDALRRDVVTVRDQLLAAARDVSQQQREISASDLATLLSGQSERNDVLLAQLAAGTDALRTDLAVVRDELLEANELTRNELLGKINVLLEEWREESAVLASIKRDTVAAYDALSISSARLDSLSVIVERLEEGIVDLQNRGVMTRLKRLVGRVPPPMKSR